MNPFSKINKNTKTMTTITESHVPAAPVITARPPQAAAFGTETDKRRHPERVDYLVGRLRCRLSTAAMGWETWALLRDANPDAAIESRRIAEQAELQTGEILLELRGIMGERTFEQWCGWIGIAGFCHSKAAALIEQFLGSLNHKDTKEAA